MYRFLCEVAVAVSSALYLMVTDCQFEGCVGGLASERPSDVGVAQLAMIAIGVGVLYLFLTLTLGWDRRIVGIAVGSFLLGVAMSLLYMLNLLRGRRSTEE